MSSIDTARKILFKSTERDSHIHRAWDFDLGGSVTVTWFIGSTRLLERTFHHQELAKVAAAVKAEPFEPIGNDYLASGAMTMFADAMLALGLRPVAVTLS